MVTKKTPALLQQKSATPAEMGEDLAAPNLSMVADVSHTGTIRKAVDELYRIELTPALAMKALRGARDLSDVPTFVKASMEMLRRDPNLQSVIQTRVLAVSGLPLVAEQVGKKLKDRKAAEYAQELLEHEAVEAIVPTLLINGVYLGFGVAQNFIDSSTLPWTLTSIKDVPSHFVTFSKLDGLTPLLFPQEPGGQLEPLKAGKFIYHRPGLIPGNPATSSVAYAALFYYALKELCLKNWTSFVELYGHPIRVGKYQDGLANSEQGRKNIEVLKSALRNLGGDAWAMLPKTMEIEIVEAATRNSSTEVYERICRFLDEQLAKLVLGGSLTSGTGNTGSGGSQSLGVVHNELRVDILKADAKALANTLRRYLVKPMVQWNIGPDASIPKVYFQVEEAEDVAAKVKAICELVDRGWKVPTEELYNLLDVRAPEGEEEVLPGKAPALAPTDAPDAPETPDVRPDGEDDQEDQGLTAQTLAAKGDGDELDVLIEQVLAEDAYREADASASADLLTAIESATDFDSLKSALLSAIKSGDVQAIQAAITPVATAARVAGDMGAEIGEGA